MSSISPAEAVPSTSNPTVAAALTPAEQNTWRLVNHGLAWVVLGAMILALAGLCVLLGKTMEIIVSSANTGSASGSIPLTGKHVLAIKVLFMIAGVGTMLGLIALTTGLAFAGALSPVRAARWLLFATLASSFIAIYGIGNALMLSQTPESDPYATYGRSSRSNPESTLPSLSSAITLAPLGLLALTLLGQAALASLAHHWNDQPTIARIKWYLKCQFALPALLVLGGVAFGLLLPPGVAMILITTAVNASYVYLAWLLIRNVYQLHRTILWQLEPERAKVAATPPAPKPVIDPLAD